MAATPLVRLIGVAERQHSVFTRVQALRCDLTPDELRGLVRRGIVEALYRRVYRMRGSVATFESRALAAVFCAGPGAVASAATAARLWQLEGKWSEKIHVTVPARKRIRVPSVVMHQPRGSIEVTKIGVIPVTTCLQTLVDVAPTLSEADLEDALDDARRRNLVSDKKMLAIVTGRRKPGRRGLSQMVLLLEARAGKAVSGSGKENDLARLFRDAGLPEPVAQYEIREPDGSFVAQPDFAYPDARVAVEFDSYKHHGSRRQWEHGNWRRSRMAALGWLSIPVTDRQMKTLPEHVVRNIWRALAARWTGSPRQK